MIHLRYTTLLLIYILQLLMILVKAFVHASSIGMRPCRQRALKLFSSPVHDDRSFKVNLKLPIVQLYKYEELVAEIICGVDYNTAISKLNALLSQYKNDSSIQSLEYISWPVDNLYSETSLVKYLSSERYTALKLYRTQCQMCQKFDSTFQGFARSSLYSHIRWLQADVDSLPDLKEELISRLSGQSKTMNVISSSSDKDDCVECANTGFLNCPICVGVGHLMKGQIAVFCPECLGNKELLLATYKHECRIITILIYTII